MKNKSKLRVILLIVVLVLFAVVLFLVLLNNAKRGENNISINTPTENQVISSLQGEGESVKKENTTSTKEETSVVAKEDSTTMNVLKTYRDESLGYYLSYPASFDVSIDEAGKVSLTDPNLPLNPTTIVKAIDVADNSTSQSGIHIVSYNEEDGWVAQKQKEDGSLYFKKITPIRYTPNSGLPILSGGYYHGFGWYSYIVALSHTKFLIISGPDSAGGDKPYNVNVDPTLIIAQSVTLIQQ